MADEQKPAETPKKPTRKKKNTLRRVLLTIIIIIVVFSLLFELFGNRLIKSAVEKVASKTLKVGVTLKKISLSPLAGKLKIKELVVKNPEGYKKAKVHNYIKNLDGKMLIIHGSVDPTVVPQNSMTLLQEAVNNQVQVDFFTYPMHPHNVRGKD